MDALAERWPMRRFPLLVDGDRTVIETSTIIQHLQVHHPGRWAAIPAEPDAALEVRMLDRFFDNYVSTPQQKVVFDALRPGDARDPRGVAEAVAMLETAYAWLDQRMATRTGRRRSASVSPTAAPRPSCSMRISPSRPPPRACATCGRTGRGCWSATRSRGRWTKRVRTGRCFPCARSSIEPAAQRQMRARPRSKWKWSAWAAL